ncbi:glycosyltransferase family 2 protein [Chroococcidiopsis sp. FACHB-1243]|uniref:glycosyltransferase family 2 protein n=1 Tax=Chroococcidiopsis sp. [FACHB-1243] TaxID=2692781 RepID=UPI00177CCFC9|nr:glycosyltransferase family 2 protein [Chroococcidiopsis sp. [FACHB-1243]]MBD2309522.1 glycosyltransferase family 2 protein [Chroococcidiopsis sp. [FACHB-1243]]
MLKTPVVLIIFKRPDTTKKVFESIRQAKPLKLLVVADGPRTERLDEVEKCTATRNIIEQVDWNCEVLKNYSDINLGCGCRPATGITWAFNQVEEAIILEDDCLPHPLFFRFCEEMLEKYKEDTRIMHISGTNFQFGRSRTDYSYYFSRYPVIWGWATWRRAWKNFDFEMKQLPEIITDHWLTDILKDKKHVDYWKQLLLSVYNLSKPHVWDYQWTFSCWTQSGLSITPQVNLVSNIGYELNATNTRERNSPYANIPSELLAFPLNHPPFIIQNMEADTFVQKTLFKSNLIANFKTKIRNILSK